MILIHVGVGTVNNEASTGTYGIALKHCQQETDITSAIKNVKVVALLTKVVVSE